MAISYHSLCKVNKYSSLHGACLVVCAGAVA